MRSTLVVLAGLSVLGFIPSPVAAQEGAFGVGVRLAMVRDDAHVDSDAVRFTGGLIRARLSKRTAVELSLDFNTLTSLDQAVRTRDRPFQASLLLYPVKSVFSPYLLGGVGWYKRNVDLMADDEVVSTVSNTEFGYHAGFGAQLRMGGHAGLHADYRYTFLHFGDDEDTAAFSLDSRSSLLPSPSGLLPGYRGSMWTAGLTVYF